MNILPREKRALILKLFCRHSGINDIADITGCSPNTVNAQLIRFGTACTALHNRLVRGVSPSRVQLDELWSYVYVKRDSNLRKRDRNKTLGPRVAQPPEERGQRYTWIAFDADSKTVISFFTGDRGANSALLFLHDLSQRVLTRPLLTSDAHNPYPDAIQRTFGANVDHVVMQKEFKSWFNPETGEKGNALTSLTKVAQNQSKVDIDLASTSHIERMNATIRNFNARFTRQTYRFSKKLENHAHALAICIMYYNFVRSHCSFLKTEWKHCSPAMKAGISDRAWTYDDFLDQIEGTLEKLALEQRPTTAPPPALPQYIALDAGRWSDQPFLVSYSALKRTAKVHAAHCRDCRRAATGRTGSRAHLWYDFATKKEAINCAEDLAPMNFSVCSICILGRYPGSRSGNGGRRTAN